MIYSFHSQLLYNLDEDIQDFEKAWNANDAELKNAKLSTKLIETIRNTRKTLNPKQEYAKLEKDDIQLLSVIDEKFPTNLKNISSPPFLLYVRGNIDILNTPSVAVVGSRKISDYGKHAVTSVIRDIAHSGVTIVSGLALGTDALAHREALDTNGITVAVLAGGIDDKTITPHSHTHLAKQIINNGGAIISEYPIGTEPNRGTFPTRNRIMAGLSDATIIIEATAKSGTLITAEFAHKFKRKLFALPGSIFTNNSVGPNTLIRDGKAKALLCADDITQIFIDVVTEHCSITTEPVFTNKNQKLLYGTIKKHPDGAQINTIIKETNLKGSEISSELTMMEIDGIIKNIGNQTYIPTH